MVGGREKDDGGHDVNIDTTEMLVHGGSSWSLVGALPTGAISGLSSVSLNNEIFVTGDK